MGVIDPGDDEACAGPFENHRLIDEHANPHCFKAGYDFYGVMIPKDSQDAVPGADMTANARHSLDGRRIFAPRRKSEITCYDAQIRFDVRQKPAQVLSPVGQSIRVQIRKMKNRKAGEQFWKMFQSQLAMKNPELRGVSLSALVLPNGMENPLDNHRQQLDVLRVKAVFAESPVPVSRMPYLEVQSLAQVLFPQSLFESQIDFRANFRLYKLFAFA